MSPSPRTPIPGIGRNEIPPSVIHGAHAHLESPQIPERQRAIDPERLHSFVMKMLDDAGAAMGASLIQIGDRLGLYKYLAAYGPMTAAALAKKTGTTERYVREWLAAQAAAGYVSYEPRSANFHMTPEQVAIFADEESEFFLASIGDLVCAVARDEPKIESAFRTGGGVGWDQHDPCLFCGTARFFRSAYKHHLVQDWLPALDGVTDKLKKGATVADVGCGHGISTVLMAKAFPRSHFYGFDYHAPSVEAARAKAAEEGVSGRVDFHAESAKTYADRIYDLICFFDCLHDMGDPLGALKHARSTVAPDGTVMLVEPYANDRLEENLNPVGRIYYAASTMICTPASLAQEVGLALGAQAGEAKIRQLAEAAGFTRFRRAAETPFNLVFELRP